MASIVRTRVLSRVFGEGVTGVVGVAVASWAIDKVREGIGSDPELLDISQLKAGETYTIVTRPAPSRRERKLAIDHAKLTKASAKAVRLSGSQRKAGRAATKAVDRAAKLVAKNPESSKAQSAQQVAARLVARSERLNTPSKKAVALNAQLTKVSNELADLQSASMDRASRSRRSARREFR